MASVSLNPHSPIPALRQLGEGQAEPFQVSKSKRDCLIDLDLQSNMLSQKLDVINLTPEEVTQIIQVFEFSEKQCREEALETARHLEGILAQEKERIEALLKNIATLEEERVDSDSKHLITQDTLLAQIKANKEELARRRFEIKKLRLQISLNKVQTKKRIAALEAEKVEAVRRAEEAGKATLQTERQQFQLALLAKEEEWMNRLRKEEARAQAAEALAARTLAEKNKLEQAFESREAEYNSKIQVLEEEKHNAQKLRAIAAELAISELPDPDGGGRMPDWKIESNMKAWRREEQLTQRGLQIIAAKKKNQEKSINI